MIRNWRMLVWTGKTYREAHLDGRVANGDGTFQARSPAHALKVAGLDDPGFYTIKYSRKGYGHYTGRVYAYAPETVAAGEHVPADFILEVVK